MNFSNLISDSTGAVHLIFSILALITGSFILIGQKGTVLHKRIGYAYVVSMTVVLVTAFAIYSLYGSFGIFHWMALFSSVTLAGGMIPMIFRRPRKSYIAYHFSFMYWSVIGLYGAFIAETLVRIPEVVIESSVPNSTFYTMTGIGTFVVMMAGNIFFFRNKNKWMRQYGLIEDESVVSDISSIDQAVK